MIFQLNNRIMLVGSGSKSVIWLLASGRFFCREKRSVVAGIGRENGYGES